MEETLKRTETFGATGQEISFAPSTANAADRTVDVVWYGGLTVPRVNSETDEPYMLRLNMGGARLDRLNAGAPVFDSHMTGMDGASAMADQLGTRAQRGHVVKAWVDGSRGIATLQFGVAGENADTDQLWSGIASGRVRNLSFGTWIYAMSEVMDAQGNGITARHPSGCMAQVFEANDWEPFEVSAVTVPADYTTEFLSAVGQTGSVPKSQEKKPAMETNTGADAQNLDAVRAEAVTAERARVAAIRSRGQKLSNLGIGETFIASLIDGGTSVSDSAEKFQDELVRLAGLTTNGKPAVHINPNVQITRDGDATKFTAMEHALLLRANPDAYKPESQEFGMAREYRGFSLLEMAREALTVQGVNTRGMSKAELAGRALLGSGARVHSFDATGTTSDFPSILANVANKTLRQGYQAYPQTYQPFCRQVTASDFKPVNRAQLNDLGSLQKLNERGEYHRGVMSDGNISYSLGTFGEVVSLTRKTIINDDMGAFTRTPALLGTAAARTQSDIVWGVITANAAAQFPGDASAIALFHASHSNLATGAGSALGLTGIAAGRLQLRLQKAPQGTPLNLTPRYIAVPAALENTALQLIYPTQLAATAVTGVVPSWVQSLIPIVEPRLDANSAGAWYLIADPTQIDTVEYCFLEGQAGVYFETKQGFEVDGIEMKARMDFAAAAIEFRGMQKNAGS